MSVAADDRDPNWNYFGDWLLDGTGNPAIHDGTLSQTNVVSSGATFTFTGTQISVFGVVRSLPAGAVPPASTYKVDGGDAVTYNAPNLTSGEGDHMLFFASDNLAPASHILLINVIRVSGDAPYLLDYVTYMPTSSASPSKSPTPTPDPQPSPTPTPTQAPSPPSTPSQAPSPAQPNSPSANTQGTLPASSPSASSASSASSSQGSSSASSSSPQQTFEQSVSHEPLPSSLSLSSSSGSASGTGLAEGGASGASVRSSNHVGPIVGGVIGGVILLILIVVGILFWRRRRRNAPGHVADYFASPPTPVTREVFTTPGITPYLLSGNQPGSGAQQGYSNPFDSPSDPDHTNSSGATPYIATVPSKSRSPTRLVPNRPAYGEMSMSPDTSVTTPPDSAYAPSTEQSDRTASWLRPGATSPSGNSSSQSSRSGPRGPRDDVKGSISGARPLPARPPAQHADSGMRFAPPRPPPTEVMSEVMSEIPPAYTAS